jgi:hypothetical protein
MDERKEAVRLYRFSTRDFNRLKKQHKSYMQS